MLPAIVGAANYFDLPGLCQKVEEVTKQLMQSNRCLACAFWEECRTLGPALGETNSIEHVALMEIRRNPTKILIEYGGIDVISDQHWKTLLATSLCKRLSWICSLSSRRGLTTTRKTLPEARTTGGRKPKNPARH